jgi:hypothetical protein
MPVGFGPVRRTGRAGPATVRAMRPLLLSLLVGCAGGPAGQGADTAPVDPCPRRHPTPSAEALMTFAPYLQWVDPGRARLRFETGPDDIVVPVLLDRGGDCPEELVPERTTRALTHYWPTADNSLDLDHPDLPGDHVLHEVVFDLAPGDVVGWTVDAGAPTPWQGTLRGGAADLPFTAVFIGDTMAPNSDAVFEGAALDAPDLYLHGGDLQYQTNPVDTWAGLSHAARPLTASAAFHPAAGNHEHEERDEYSQMYQRLFSDLGTGAPADDATVLDYGGVRFLGLNSEGDLADPDGAQAAWLAERLAEADADPDIREVVPFFHRPAYTLAGHGPSMSLRAVLEPLFAAHGVRLVLQAHNHSYERFVVGGTTWVVDGGGGALLYNVDNSVADHPDEAPLRVAKSQTFGHTRLEFAPDGSIALRRFDVTGAEVDRATLPAR